MSTCAPFRLPDLRATPAALDVITRYYPRERFPQKAFYALEDILGRLSPCDGCWADWAGPCLTTDQPVGTVALVARGNAKDKLLDAALSLIREQGFAGTAVDDLCDRAGVTKGAFFHHFESKDALGVAAVEHWSRTTGALFRAAEYHQAPDALGRVRAYLALRKSLIRGELSQFTCVAGTLVQETYASRPTIRAACADSIFGHAETLVEDFAVALKERGGKGDLTAQSLAAHTQCVLQGAFILAKACGDARIAVESIEHLQRYIELLFSERPEPRPTRERAKPKRLVKSRNTPSSRRRMP